MVAGTTAIGLLVGHDTKAGSSSTLGGEDEVLQGGGAQSRVREAEADRQKSALEGVP